MRAKAKGTASRPRLSVFRSHRYIYAQLIDDVSGRTLASAKGESAKAVGEVIGEKAKTIGIGGAVFDRGSYRYHGRVHEVAEGARGKGLKL